MSVSAIGPVNLPPVVSPIRPVGAEAAGSATGASGTNFATALGQGLEQLQQLHSTTDAAAVKAATGELTDVHDYMIASSQSGLATQLTMAVRNKAIDAFSEIMRMQA
jgi:flagellar hook-basal body complex protein FliE